jgi:membrane peptidoglycan carboxypeptidase
MLPLHLSQSEVEVAFLSQAYMGPGVRGFDQASKQYLGAGLQDLSTKQAAKLVAIVHAPTAYLASPERLERRAQYLLSLQPQ